jgi:7-cyano-7-deazaguanine synthase
MAGKPADAHAPAADWWPFRNQLLITVAAMKAMQFGVSHLLIGTVSTDSAHSDGSLEFVENISRLTSIQEGALIVEAPAISLRTADLIRSTKTPMSLLAWAHSCHKANMPCWNCRGCNKYFEVLQELANEPTVV